MLIRLHWHCIGPPSRDWPLDRVGSRSDGQTCLLKKPHWHWHWQVSPTVTVLGPGRRRAPKVGSADDICWNSGLINVQLRASWIKKTIQTRQCSRMVTSQWLALATHLIPQMCCELLVNVLSHSGVDCRQWTVQVIGSGADWHSPKPAISKF